MYLFCPFERTSSNSPQNRISKLKITLNHDFEEEKKTKNLRAYMIRSLRASLYLNCGYIVHVNNAKHKAEKKKQKMMPLVPHCSPGRIFSFAQQALLISFT